MHTETSLESCAGSRPFPQHQFALPYNRQLQIHLSTFLFHPSRACTCLGPHPFLSQTKQTLADKNVESSKYHWLLAPAPAILLLSSVLVSCQHKETLCTAKRGR